MSRVIWLGEQSTDTQNESIKVECRDRYLSVSTSLSFAGSAPRVEAVDAQGVHPITGVYASECGYTLSPQPDHAEYRASYFSCHTGNQDDEVFTFSFNFITTNEDGEEVTHAVNQTCSPALPWSPREVVCEENYMEVTVRSDMSRLSGTSKENWNDPYWNQAVTTALGSATSDWQVMFQGAGQPPLTAMSLSEARRRGYVFDRTAGRLVFRSPYGKPESFVTTLNSVSVEVIRSTLYSRQNWVVMMVDLVAACSMHKGSYDGARLVWETPVVLPPLVPDPSRFESRAISMGVNGQLLYQTTMTERGYIMNTSDAAVQISIPYNAEGGYRKSFVMDNMYYEFYTVPLYYEHVFVLDDEAETRLRLHRQMATPLHFWPPVTINHTILEEHVFTVSLEVPSDVLLVAVNLNGQDFTGPDFNQLSADIHGFSISIEPRPNSPRAHLLGDPASTNAYILRVPWQNALVSNLYTDSGVLEYWLDINYTLVIMPGEDPYHHQESVRAVMTGIFPPDVVGVCSESGISFMLDFQPFNYLWEVYIGPHPLTPELAAKRGYVMQNDSQSLFLDVPLFTIGYKYEDIGLKQFFAKFEILIRYAKTSQVKSSATKRCPFQTTELIVCSTSGQMTVVTNVTKALSGAEPTRTSLLKRTCLPIETDNSFALFQFGLNTCGTTVRVNARNVTYENEILVASEYDHVTQPSDPSNPPLRVVLQCVYPLSGLYLLFAERRFESAISGVGYMLTPQEIPRRSTSLIRWHPTMKPYTSMTPATTTETTTAPQTISTRVPPTKTPPTKAPPTRPPAMYLSGFPQRSKLGMKP